MNSNNKRRVRKYPRGARGVPRHICLFRKSKHMQRWFMRNPWMKPMLCFTLAVIKMQAFVRKYIVRRLGAKQWRKKLYKKKKPQPSQLNRYLATMDFYSRSKRRKPEYLDDGYSAWCAVRIQAWWRMVPKRRRFLFLVKDIYQIGAIQIQNTWRHRRAKQKSRGMTSRTFSASNLPRTREGHARAIQTAWRTHCNVRVYRYFKDLILHKLKGAPVDLLRCIVPGEADLLDRASGVHVRFRLGGHIFPPKIYYKIFTHRPLCDLNAFAPRNYANESLVAPVSLHLNPQRRDQPLFRGAKEQFSVSATHMRVGGALFDATVDTSGGTRDWYKREDRNYWRPISHEASDDPMFETPYKSMSRSESTFNSTKMKKAHYHFSRFKRQEDVVRERKKKKRDWMLKAYMFSAGQKGEDLDDGDCVPCEETPVSYRKQPLGQEHGQRQGQGHWDNSPRESSSASASPRGRCKTRELLLSDSFSEDGGGNEAIDVAAAHARVPTTDVMEDDDLLKWSLALDFEVYNTAWAGMAVSMPSDCKYSSMSMCSPENPSKTSAAPGRKIHVVIGV